jgi:hypothetical protein
VTPLEGDDIHSQAQTFKLKPARKHDSLKNKLYEFRKFEENTFCLQAKEGTSSGHDSVS